MSKTAAFLFSLALVALFFLAAWTFVIAPTMAAIGTTFPF
jgi:hypothetical protein